MYLNSALGVQLFDADFAHAEFLDLARHRNQEFLHDSEMLGRLEMRNAAFAPRLQFQLAGRSRCSLGYTAHPCCLFCRLTYT